jgi:hypothetical protein
MQKVVLLMVFLAISTASFGINLHHKDTTKEEKTKRVGILPVPAFGFSPETDWYFGVVSLFTLNLFPEDTLSRTSTAKIQVNYTLNKQLVTEMGWTILFREERFVLQGDNSYQKFPENFWGIGAHTPDENEELYESNRLELDNTFLHQFKPHWYAGPSMRFQYITGIETVQNGNFDTLDVPGRNGGISSGLGAKLLFDTRENLFTPSAGNTYLELSSLYFGPTFVSDYTFTTFRLDARKYLKTFDGHVLALQTFQQYTLNDPPFRMMPLMGSDSHMRGYYRGRYRDKVYVSGQAEYRLPVWRKWGLALFGGVGEVASEVGELNWGALRHSYGGGIRFLIDKEENVNLRLDFAVAGGSTGFYISFGESF